MKEDFEKANSALAAGDIKCFDTFQGFVFIFRSKYKKQSEQGPVDEHIFYSTLDQENFPDSGRNDLFRKHRQMPKPLRIMTCR